MAIWFRNFDLAELNAFTENTIISALGIEFTEIGDQHLSGTLPVDKRTVQPAGILHGGASVVLAETLGSLASTLVINTDDLYCVGLEVNANHLRPATDGLVHGKASPLHLGKSTHLWHIEIRNEAGKLVCVSRLTIAIRSKKK